MNLTERLKQIKQDTPAVFLALKQPDTPLPAKLCAAVTVAYALSPIDLIPDFIPVLGYLDDLILLPLLISLTVKLIPPPVMDRCREESRDLWANGKPQKWYYAIPILLFWILILLFILRFLFK